MKLILALTACLLLSACAYARTGVYCYDPLIIGCL